MRMFYLGGQSMLRRDALIGIFDLDTATVSRHSRDFLRHAQENGAVETVGDDLPRSFVVTSDGSVYLSPQGSAALAKKLLTIP